MGEFSEFDLLKRYEGEVTYGAKFGDIKRIEEYRQRM